MTDHEDHDETALDHLERASNISPRRDGQTDIPQVATVLTAAVVHALLGVAAAIRNKQ